MFVNQQAILGKINHVIKPQTRQIFVMTALQKIRVYGGGCLNRGTPQIILYISHYNNKPTTLGVPYFEKPPDHPTFEPHQPTMRPSHSHSSSGDHQAGHNPPKKLVPNNLLMITWTTLRWVIKATRWPQPLVIIKLAFTSTKPEPNQPWPSKQPTVLPGLGGLLPL